MASTGAVLYARPTVTMGLAAARQTAAVCYLPLRALTGVFTAGVDATSDPTLGAWLPNARTPIGWVTVNGQRLPVEIDAMSWYRFFTTVAETRLGGIAGKSIPDVTSTIEGTQNAAVATSSQVAALAQQAQTNAEALSSSVQVLQNNALPGANQIPPVARNPYENLP